MAPAPPFSHDVSETKGVRARMAKALSQSMSLKSRELADFAVPRHKKESPRKSASEAGMLLKTNGAKNASFRASHDVIEKQ
jgi:hypothetical protein